MLCEPTDDADVEVTLGVDVASVVVTSGYHVDEILSLLIQSVDARTGLQHGLLLLQYTRHVCDVMFILRQCHVKSSLISFKVMRYGDVVFRMNDF